MEQHAMNATEQFIHENLFYNAETGNVWWRKKLPRCRMRVEVPAGYLNQQGYLCIEIFNKHFALHRVIWFIMTGKWPEKPLDHINGVRNDNRWVNLREATVSQNNINSPGRKVAKSGARGVNRVVGKSGITWRAQIKVAGRTIHLGTYGSKEEAAAAYASAARATWGEWAANIGPTP